MFGDDQTGRRWRWRRRSLQEERERESARLVRLAMEDLWVVVVDFG